VKIKTVTICSSASHYKQVLDIEKELKKLGFKVKIPSTAKTMGRLNNFDVEKHKTWFKNKQDYYKKTKFIVNHFKKIIAGDAILVLNLEKRGMKGYIGGNTLMEMTIAFQYKKPIFIYNQISDDLPFAEEVYGVNPIFLNGDLTKIKG
jgi:LPS O-antigen subunit length determinant protein (WzzB/FepE family)